MGFLDSILQSVLGGGPQQGALVKTAMDLILNHGSGQGLAGLLQQLQQAGLGEQAASWVGTGANQPVSPDQVQQALGNDKIQQVSQQTGMSGSDVAAQLAVLLPQLINHVTPKGEVPANNDVQSMLGGLLRSLG